MTDILQNLKNARWQYAGQKAELVVNDIAIIEMTFGPELTKVKTGQRIFEISLKGFWRPKIIITENDTVITEVKNAGIWGTGSECVLDNQTYAAKTKQGRLFNVTYYHNATEILGYRFATLNRKPIITFSIKSFHVPEMHLFLLLALGVYTIRNAAVEALAGDFIVTAVA